jgi:hypothetical protein
VKNINADTATFYLIKLNDNTALSGKIIERNSNEIIFDDITIGKVIIPIKKIEKISAVSGNQYCILTTHDGKKFSGQIVNQNDKELILKTESLGNISIPNSKIREIKLAEKEQFYHGQYFFPNPHSTRYFFGPSAIPLEKGEGYYQNAYVLSNSVQVGVTDHFSMGGGVVIPFLFFLTPKFGYKVAKNVYLGGGLLVAASFIPDMHVGLGVGYGSITLGNKENNFTLNAGWGFSKSETYNSSTQNYDYKWKYAKKPMFSINGAVRIAPKLSLITENWIFATEQYTYDSVTNTETYESKYSSIISFGFRIMGEKNSFDIAMAIPTVEGQTFGLPYLDYVFKF